MCSSSSLVSTLVLNFSFVIPFFKNRKKPSIVEIKIRAVWRLPYCFDLTVVEEFFGLFWTVSFALSCYQRSCFKRTGSDLSFLQHFLVFHINSIYIYKVESTVCPHSVWSTLHFLLHVKAIKSIVLWSVNVVLTTTTISW